MSECQAQDSLVFAFSGHGALDTISEDQGRDGILPCDFLEVTHTGFLHDAFHRSNGTHLD